MWKRIGIIVCAFLLAVCANESKQATPTLGADASVMMVDGEVIGGTSFPDSAEPLTGVAHSLDGKTAEELHPDYMDWRNEWEAKYSE